MGILQTVNTRMTNSEDPEEMKHIAAFLQGLHLLLFMDRNTPKIRKL